MAKAIRSDALHSPGWVSYAQKAKADGAGSLPVKCPDCDVEYTALIFVLEDTEKAVTLLRDQLPRDCPQHPFESYLVNERPYEDKIIGEKDSPTTLRGGSSQRRHK
jgi:hypothetical protein